MSENGIAKAFPSGVDFRTCPSCNGYGLHDNGKACTTCGGRGRQVGSGEIMTCRETGRRITARELATALRGDRPRAKKAKPEAGNVLRQRCGSLEGKTLVYRRDPLFGRCGWCIRTGELISEMQTMGWVDALVPMRGAIDQTGIVKDGKLILADAQSDEPSTST